MDNITIRKITLADTDDVIRFRNNPAVLKNFLDRRLLTKESHENYFHSRIETGLVHQFMILKDGISIGCVFLRDVDLKEKTAEFGIFIGDEQEFGKGYGKKATRLILEYAFNELNLERVILRVLKLNEFATRSYISSGFKFDYEKTNENGETVVFMHIDKKDF